MSSLSLRLFATGTSTLFMVRSSTQDGQRNTPRKGSTSSFGANRLKQSEQKIVDHCLLSAFTNLILYSLHFWVMALMEIERTPAKSLRADNSFRSTLVVIDFEPIEISRMVASRPKKGLEVGQDFAEIHNRFRVIYPKGNTAPLDIRHASEDHLKPLIFTRRSRKASRS